MTTESNTTTARPQVQAEELFGKNAWVERRSRNRTWMRFRRHKLALLGSVILILLVLMAIFAPWITTGDPYTIDVDQIKVPPSPGHLLGGDTAGRDVWTRLAFASRVSLSVGIVAVAIYVAIGVILGAVSGYYGGSIDSLVMRFTDIIMCFPDLIIIIVVVAFIGPSIYNVMFAIGLLGWPGTARLVRGQFLSLREKEFVEAARCLGVPTTRIVFRHLLPNVVPYLIIVATLGTAGAILTEAGLSFLGLGVQPPTPSWGNMLFSAQNLTTLERYPHLWVPPGLMIALAVLAINFIGDGLRDALDPKQVIK